MTSNRTLTLLGLVFIAALGLSCEREPDFCTVKIIRYNEAEPGFNGTYAHSVVEDSDGRRFMVNGRWGTNGETVKIDLSRCRMQ